MKRRSIRFRLTAWYAAILAVTFGGAGFAIQWAIRDSINDTADKELRARVQPIRRFLGAESTGNAAGQLQQELAEQVAIVPAGTEYRIAAADGRWTYASAGTTNWPSTAPARDPLPTKGRGETFVSGDKPYRVLSAPAPTGVVQIGMPVDEFYEMLDDFTWTALLASPVVLCLASFGGYWMSGRALAPISRIAGTAGQIGAQNLSHRLPLCGNGDELDQLSSTLNSMFERLEAAFQHMAQFTADASHELRTPTAIIRSTAELCRSKARTREEYEDALDRILAASERMSGLIEDLMVLVRADSGQDGIELVPLELSEVIEETYSEMRVLAEAAGLCFECNTEHACEVRGDEQALHRLFLILIDNAIKYTPRGGTVSLTLNTEGNGPSAVAILEVRDTGIGISAHDLTHIFNRFYRVGNHRSRESGGAGLGLAIGNWIAQQHGGDILVESSPGRGSTFRVRLPALNASAILQNGVEKQGTAIRASP